MISEGSIAIKSSIYTSNPFIREQIALNMTEKEVHLHVIDTIINLEDELETKADLLSRSVPYPHLIISRVIQLAFKSIISAEEANSLIRLIKTN